MEKKKIVLLIIIILIIVLIIPIFKKKNGDNISIEQTQQENKITESSVDKSIQKDNIIVTEDNKDSNKAKKNDTQQLSTEKQSTLKKNNMYDNVPSNMMPLSAISESAGQTKQIKSAISGILNNSNGIYFIKNTGSKLLIISESPSNIRHGIDFTELNINSGHKITSMLGYSDKMKDSNNDYWEYDKTTDLQKPIKHIKYKEDGDADFVETWNYDSENNTKYEMKDADGNVISIKKETLDDNNNLRIEHLIYDKTGKTKINVSASYEGADLKRFTYYNADKPSESASVFYEYTDGIKTKETVYNSQLQVINVYKPEYKENTKSAINVYDAKNNLIETIYAE